MADSNEDFARLFEASTKAKRLERGQIIEGRVVGIGAEVAFVDVGGKGEATIDLDELKDNDGRIEVAVGDRVQAMVVSTSAGVILSRKLARSAATDRQLEDAWRTGLPVEGKVDRAVKGGYEIRIGQRRAFCPASQIDIHRSDTAAHEGRVYEFRIIEYKENGRTIVVSRRHIVEEQQRAEAEKVRASIVPGAIITGRVASVRDFGAFVDVGAGVQGLLHVSEMGWSRVNDPLEIVKPGDEITVRVLRVDDEKQKISLGLKQLTADPWAAVAETYAIGQVRTGRVTRITSFGAFVELEPGIEALAHASTFVAASRADEWTKQVTVGMTGPFEIVAIDTDKKRIAVELKSGAYDDEGAATTHSAPEGGFGTLADKLRDALKPRER